MCFIKLFGKKRNFELFKNKNFFYKTPIYFYQINLKFIPILKTTIIRAGNIGSIFVSAQWLKFDLKKVCVGFVWWLCGESKCPAYIKKGVF